MRVFLSAFSGFTLAVPMNAVAAMMLYDKKTEKVIQYDQKDRNTYISLPRLFNLNEEDVHHGIILREWNTTTNKVVLLTAEIKRDIEIPDKEFHPIPKSLGALRFSRIFNGIKFSDKPILLLNIEQLTQLLQEEQQAFKGIGPSAPPSPPLEQPPSKEPLPKAASVPSPPPPEPEPQIEQPPLEQPLSEEPPPTAASVPSPPPPEPEPQIEQPTQIIQEDQQARNEIEPLTDLLVLEDLPSEAPPEQPLSTAASEVEPLTDLLVLEDLPSEEPPPEQQLPIEPLMDLLLEDLPSEEPPEELQAEEPPEELLIEELPEELLIEEPPSEELPVEEPPTTTASKVEPLTKLLVLLSEELL